MVRVGLAVVLVFVLAGCGSDGPVDEAATAPSTTAVATTSAPQWKRLEPCRTEIVATTRQISDFLTAAATSTQLDGALLASSRNQIGVARRTCRDALPECPNAASALLDGLDQALDDVANLALHPDAGPIDLDINPVKCGTTTLIPGVTTPPTTQPATTTTSADPAEAARALFRAVSPMQEELREASSQLEAAMIVARDDPASSTLLAVPGQKLVDVYATHMFAWQQVDAGALGEPYTSVFQELRRVDERFIDVSKSFAACSSGCDADAIYQRYIDVVIASGDVLIKLGALIPTN